jgi:DNA-binding transcriptional MerR regulator
MFTTNQIASMFQVNRQTIVNWCVEFAGYLSPHANPGSGHRRITEDDLTVLTLVATMKREGKTLESIAASLAVGSRAAPPESALAVISSSPGGQLALYRQRVSDLEEENERLTAELERLKPYEVSSSVEKALRERAEEDLKRVRADYERLLVEKGVLQGRADLKDNG